MSSGHLEMTVLPRVRRIILTTCLLLYLIGKDKKIKNGFRIVAKIGMIFLIFCYIAGLVAEKF